MVSQRGLVSSGHLNSNLPPGHSSASAFPATTQQPFPSFTEKATWLRLPPSTPLHNNLDLRSALFMEGAPSRNQNTWDFRSSLQMKCGSQLEHPWAAGSWQQVVRKALPPCVSVREALSRDKKKKKWGWGEYSYSRKNIQGRKLRIKAVHI